MSDLNELRQTIDAIDRQLILLFEERMKTAEAVASFKAGTNKAVYDAVREQEKLEKIAGMAQDPDNVQPLTAFFKQLMTLSRIRQYVRLGEALGPAVSDLPSDVCSAQERFSKNAVFHVCFEMGNDQTPNRVIDLLMSGGLRVHRLTADTDTAGTGNIRYDCEVEGDSEDPAVCGALTGAVCEIPGCRVICGDGSNG